MECPFVARADGARHTRASPRVAAEAPMHDTILVPLDGSPFAEQVLPLAATVARRSGLTLELVKAHRPRPVGYAQDTMLQALDVTARERAFASEYLRRTAHRVGESADIRVVTRSIFDPAPTAEAICAEAERVNAAMIAMTTHGRTGLLRMVRGSVADGVLRHATIPVLLLRSGDESPPATAPRHVLVALDGSTWAEMVLPAATALASALEARVTLLEVVANVQAVVPEAIPVPAEVPYGGAGYTMLVVDEPATRRAIERATGYVGRMVERVRRAHPQLLVAGRVENDDHAAPAIVKVAAEVGADLVAMATHGRGSSRLLVGSTVDGVLGHRVGATLLVRPTTPMPRE
jgi:nucleotide-binding universal stress UspA family protein